MWKNDTDYTIKTKSILFQYLMFILLHLSNLFLNFITFKAKLTYFTQNINKNKNNNLNFVLKSNMAIVAVYRMN